MDEREQKLSGLLSEISRLRLLHTELDKQILVVEQGVRDWYECHDMTVKYPFDPKKKPKHETD